MARIRTIKPDFWTSEQVVMCSYRARLLFIGMLNFSDDHGIHPKSYMRLKMEVLPADDCAIDDIKAAIAELIVANLIIEYEVDQKEFWLVTGFKTHQKIDKPTYKFPLPNNYQNQHNQLNVLSTISSTIDEQSSSTSREVDEESPNSCRTVAKLSPSSRLGNGREWNGKEEDISKVPRETLPVFLGENSAAVTELFDYWKLVMNHPKAKLDNARKKKIIAAIKLGFSVDKLKQAIDGCSKSPWHMGNNDQKKKYDNISLVFRNAEKIEQFIGFIANHDTTDDTHNIVSQIDQIAKGAI